MEVVNCLKRFIRAVVPHIIVLAVLFGYLIFGAAVFRYLESGSSDLEMYTAELGKLRDFFIGSTKVDKDLVPPVPVDYGNGTAPTAAAGVAYTAMPAIGTPAPVDIDEMVDELMDRSFRPEWKDGRVQAMKSNRTWSFASSMLFCLTTITTIGYGDVVPVTVAGKAFCVLYSIFGIPLTMLYLGGVGTFLAHLILTLCKILNLGQPIKRAVCSPCGSRDKRDSYEDVHSSKGDPPPASADENAAEKAVALEETEIVTSQHGMESAGGGVPDGPVEDELEAPVILVVGIMVGYMCAGAFMMSGIEEWTFGEALYFTFITLTTIGFGDYVPTNLYREDAFFVCMVYAMFGLAVMSMCIALAQAKVIRLGRRAWECIGC